MARWLDERNLRPLQEALFETAARNADRTALDYFGRELSYSELTYLTFRCADALAALAPSERRGERVAILMPNIPQFVIAYYGALTAGMVPVLVNFSSIVRELKSKKPGDIAPSEEIKAQFADVKPVVIFAAEMFWPIVREVLPAIPACSVALTGVEEFLSWRLKLPFRVKTMLHGAVIRPPYGGNIHRLKDVTKRALAAKPVGVPSLDDVAEILYTGGTTGTPKGAMLTHRNVMTNMLQCREHIGDLIEEPVVSLGVLPFFHSYGITACMHITLISFGGTIVLQPSFAPKAAVRAIRKNRVTLFPAVNRMLQTIADIKGVETPSLKLCISGAGPLDYAVKEAFERTTGARVIEGYGMTETSPVISVTLPVEEPASTAKRGERRGSVGRALPMTDIRIVHLETGVTLGPNEEGEIVVRGPQVMLGYFEKPAETAAMIRDGWLYTGDIGMMDGDGLLYITDRKKDMFTVSGENVFSRNIEEYFLASPAVRKCAVVGVPDKKTGEAAVLYAVMSSGYDASELRRLAAGLPNKLWTPKEMHIVDEATFAEWEDVIGKLKRKSVREYHARKKKA